MLRNITPDQPYFVQAREKMAEIYLHHRKDKRLYASCYRELVDKHPSPHTCLLLGDAYMSIQEVQLSVQQLTTHSVEGPDSNLNIKNTDFDCIQSSILFSSLNVP